MLGYLVKKGITDTLREGMALYPRYGVTYAKAGFADVRTVIRAIHGAGGTAILAHPGEIFRDSSPDEFMRLTAGIVDLGADGIECYYPTHTPDQTARLLAFCRERRLKITAGCDCHGAFGKTDIGQMKIDERLISL